MIKLAKGISYGIFPHNHLLLCRLNHSAFMQITGKSGKDVCDNCFCFTLYIRWVFVESPALNCLVK